MSQETVEIVRRTIEAYTVGDREAYYDFMAEDIEIRPDVSRWPEAKPFRGREKFRRFNADIDQDWEGGAKGRDQGSLSRQRPGRGAGRLGRHRAGQRYRPAFQPDFHLHRPRSADHQDRILLRPRKGPRSRWAAGVGDVAGERGDRQDVQSHLRGREPRRVA